MSNADNLHPRNVICVCYSNHYLEYLIEIGVRCGLCFCRRGSVYYLEVIGKLKFLLSDFMTIHICGSKYSIKENT